MPAKKSSPGQRPKFARLPKSTNGTHRTHFSGGAYGYQKEMLRRTAHAKGMSVSYYLNFLLWADKLKDRE